MRRYSVITDRCQQGMQCVSACLRDAIHPTANEPRFPISRQLYINRRRCIGCGACVSACDNGAIVEYEEDEASLIHFAALNAAYFTG